MSLRVEHGNGKAVSPRIVRRRLLNAGYKSYTKKKKPYRKPIHCSLRFKFAKKYSEWNFNDWKNVIFSNESHFEVFNRKNRSYVRRLPSKFDRPFNFQPRIQGGGGSVSVWGLMTANGVGPLVFYDGRMNGQNYINVIESKLLPYIKKNFGPNDSWWYVEDNAPCHKSGDRSIRRIQFVAFNSSLINSSPIHFVAFISSPCSHISFFFFLWLLSLN